jgi:hypothetical protein
MLKKYTLYTLFLFLLLSIGLNVYFYKRNQKLKEENNRQQNQTEIVSVEIKTDTIRDTIPQYIVEKVLYTKHDTLNHIEIKYDTIYNIDNSDEYTLIEGYDTIPVSVEIPITQKTYTDDSTYVAYVSGYKPSLDSINVYERTVYIDRTIVQNAKQKKWSIGPMVSYGYSFKNKELDYMVGIGISYNLIKF